MKRQTQSRSAGTSPGTAPAPGAGPAPGTGTGPAAGILLIAGLVVLAIVPALTPFVGDGFRESLMQGFSMVCHQIQGRSPHSHGVQWAVCHRDVGIYWGLPAGALAFVLTGWAPAWMNKGIPLLFAAALVPMGLDWGLDVAGILANSAPSRIVTGAVFGITSGFILAWTVLGVTKRHD